LSKIERGQFADLLRRYLGMSGETNVADELAPEVSPVFVLESERIEWEFLKGAKVAGVVANQGAAAAFPSAFRIRNPSGSNVMVVVNGWDVSIGSASSVSLARLQTNADLATVIGLVPIPRDARYPGAGVRLSAVIASSDNTVAPPFGDIFWGIGLGANIPWRWQDGFVLAPGWALTMFTNANNIALFGGAAWLEKRMDQLEFASGQPT